MTCFDSWIPHLKRLAKDPNNLTPNDRQWFVKIQEKAALLLNYRIKEIKTRLTPQAAEFEIQRDLKRLKELNLHGLDGESLNETFNRAVEYARVHELERVLCSTATNTDGKDHQTIRQGFEDAKLALQGLNPENDQELAKLIELKIELLKKTSNSTNANLNN